MNDPTRTVLADLCLVKVLVGPGNPGPAGAPSTSAGIGIEVWLPARNVWNGRVHSVGGGGTSGGEEADLNRISSIGQGGDGRPAYRIAAEEAAVSSSTDTGHTGGLLAGWAFGTNPDGTINTVLWEDFNRSLHEQAVVTKALATAYYGSAPRYSYFDGGSGGGRQAMMLAQRYPQDYDGILAVYPAMDSTRFGVGYRGYVRLVFERDLGGQLLTDDQLSLVSNAAIAACDRVGGEHLGFILHPESCRYDPTKDRAVLCTVSGGMNGTPACLTSQQALAMNKIWYGMTTDGSVPDPAVDNGFGPLTGKHITHGLPRGTNLIVLFRYLAETRMDRVPPPNASRMVPQVGPEPQTYEELSRQVEEILASQTQLDFVDANDPNLGAFKARGGRLIQIHGTNDEFITYQVSNQYYDRVMARMGGQDAVQSFYRLYLVPGWGHGATNGTSNLSANPPGPGPLRGEMYRQLTNWVERGVAPETIVFHSPVVSTWFAEPSQKRRTENVDMRSLPACVYPKKITYVRGDIFLAESYTCR